MISQRPQSFDEPYIEFWLNICMKHRSENNQVDQKGLAPGISQDLPKTWSCPEAKQDISWTVGKELQCNNLGSEENPAEIALESCISDRPEEVMCLSAAWSLSPEPLPCPSLSSGGKANAVCCGILRGNLFSMHTRSVTQCIHVRGLNFMSFVGSLVLWSTGKSSNIII